MGCTGCLGTLVLRSVSSRCNPIPSNAGSHGPLTICPAPAPRPAAQLSALPPKPPTHNTGLVPKLYWRSHGTKGPSVPASASIPRRCPAACPPILRAPHEQAVSPTEVTALPSGDGRGRGHRARRGLPHRHSCRVSKQSSTSAAWVLASCRRLETRWWI